MGHSGAQAARPARNLAGRAGRPSSSRRIFRSGSTTTSQTCPYMPDGTHCRRSRTTAAHVTGIAIWNSSMSSAVRCNISSTASIRTGCITGSRRSRGNAGSPAWWSTQNCLSGSARMSGFSSASYFINVFRRRRSVTPRVWRESRCVGRVTVRGSCHRARRHAQ